MSTFNLASLTTVNKKRGSCVVVHSAGGIGKTTFGAEACIADKGLVILGEDGLSPLGLENVPRTPILQDWVEFKNILLQLINDEHDFKTVVIDTMDNLTNLLDVHVVNTYYQGNDEKANAYKAKYTQMKTEFNGIIKAFNVLQDRGINVLVLVHSIVDNYRAPDSEAYKHWALNLPGGDKTSLASTLFDHADFVLFGKREVTVSEGSKAKGGKRVLMTQWDPAYDAKSRKDIPEKIALSWESFKKFAQI